MHRRRVVLLSIAPSYPTTNEQPRTHGPGKPSTPTLASGIRAVIEKDAPCAAPAGTLSRVPNGERQSEDHRRRLRTTWLRRWQEGQWPKVRYLLADTQGLVLKASVHSSAKLIDRNGPRSCVTPCWILSSSASLTRGQAFLGRAEQQAQQELRMLGSHERSIVRSDDTADREAPSSQMMLLRRFRAEGPRIRRRPGPYAFIEHHRVEEVANPFLPGLLG